MYLYLSTFDQVPEGGRVKSKATAQVAGADGPMIPLGNRCLVASSFALIPPAGVRFLLNTETDLDTTLTVAERTAINTQLGITVPAALTWRQLFKRLFTIEGTGRWGTLAKDLDNLRFWPLGTVEF